MKTEKPNPAYVPPCTIEISLGAGNILCASQTSAEDLNEKYDWSSELWGS